MADTTALKNRIRAAIKANDNQEITGPVLQQALLDIVDELNGATEIEAQQRQNNDSTLQQGINTLRQSVNGEAIERQQGDTQLNNLITNLITSIKNNIDNGYVYAGIATPSATPVSGKVFYVATQVGTYTNFGNTSVAQGINILKYNGSVWSKDVVIGIDDTPTTGSNNLVKSKGIYSRFADVGQKVLLSLSSNSYVDVINRKVVLDGANWVFYNKNGVVTKYTIENGTYEMPDNDSRILYVTPTQLTPQIANINTLSNFNIEDVCIIAHLNRNKDIVINDDGLLLKQLKIANRERLLQFCNSSENDEVKTFQLSGYRQVNNSRFIVKFTNRNTNEAPKLNVNNQGAYDIIYNGKPADNINTWDAGDIVEFYFSSTYNSNAGAWIGYDYNEDVIEPNGLIKSVGVGNSMKMNLKKIRLIQGRVYSFYPEDWNATAITYAKLAIKYVDLNDVEHTVFSINGQTTFAEKYTLIAEECKYYIIQTRADSGVEIKVCIVDETNNNALITSRFIGNNNTISYTDDIAIEGNKNYRIDILNQNVDMSGVTLAPTDNAVRFLVSAVKIVDNEEVLLILVSVWTALPLLSNYNIYVPDGYTKLRIGGRCTTDKQLMFKVNNIDLGDTLFFNGNKNDISYGSIINVSPRSTYRLCGINKDVDISMVTTTANAARLSIDALNDSDESIQLVRTRVGYPLADYYDVTIPEGYTRLRFSGRCSQNATLSCKIQDISDIVSPVILSQHDFITKSDYNLTKVSGKNYYKSNNSYDVILHIPHSIENAIMLCIDAYVESDTKTIAIKYNDVIATNNIIIANNSFKKKCIILPPFGYDSGEIKITVDSNILFNKFSLTEYEKQRNSDNLFIAAHLGMVYGFNNIPSFQMAGKLGFKGCVTNIRKTLDGVMVCAHDDTYTVDGVIHYISQENYADISGWMEHTGSAVYTSYWADYFGGFVLPKTEHFLEVCALTGMIPIFSIDPASFNDWSGLKVLTDKWGFNTYGSVDLKIKAGSLSNFADAYAVFGNIARYTYSHVGQTVALVESIHEIGLGDSQVIIEDNYNVTNEVIAKAKEYGYKISVFEGIHDAYGIDLLKYVNLVRAGVTNFTTDSFLSDGLPWN